MNIAHVLLAVPLLYGCAATVDRASLEERSSPRLVVASSESPVGGEARYEGELQIRNGCVVVVSNGRTALPIFDSSVKLAGEGGGIVESRNGRAIAFGGRVYASAAHLRQDGEGWSLLNIENSLGAKVPKDCGDTIVRLRDISGAE
jgi:hypothetical protein